MAEAEMSPDIVSTKLKSPPGAKSDFLRQGIFFVIPSLVVTAVSYALFSLLKGLTEEEFAALSVTIMLSVILSLIGTAGMQLLIYRIIDAGKAVNDESAALRGIRRGAVYSLVFSAVCAPASYPLFRNVLHLPVFYFVHYTILLVLYSLTWVITVAFWATGEHRYPAIIFTFSYLTILFLSYGFYGISPENTITGYTAGTAILLVLSTIAARSVFGRYPGASEVPPDVYSMRKLIPQNLAGVLFQVLYALAIFLDKLIVWVFQGIRAGRGIVVTGPYTTGAFLGLIPVFSIVAMSYFTVRGKPLLDERFKGTFEEIEKRGTAYKHLYGTGLAIMLLAGLTLFILASIYAFYFVHDIQAVKVFITTSFGVIFFVTIVYSSAVTPVFGRMRVSAVSMLAVCLGELAAIPFVTGDIWYASVGFLAGSFTGFLISRIAIGRLFTRYEYQLFRPLISSL